MRRILIWPAAMLIAACGSNVETTPSSTTTTTTGGNGGAATGSSTGGSGGASCTSGDPGGACAATVQCVMADVSCECTGGALGCTNTQQGKPVSIAAPATPPADGACCDTEGLACGGYTECGPICACKGGVWSCATPAACPSFTCPTELGDIAALGGQDCTTEVGRICASAPACTSVSCSCNLDADTGSATWKCAQTPC